MNKQNFKYRNRIEHQFLVALHNSEEGFICATFACLLTALEYAATQQAISDDEWEKTGGRENVNVFTMIDDSGGE